MFNATVGADTMQNYLVTGPGFTSTVYAYSYADAISRVAHQYRVNPLLLCAARLPH